MSFHLKGTHEVVTKGGGLTIKTLGPGFESLGRRKELSGNEDIL